MLMNIVAVMVLLVAPAMGQEQGDANNGRDLAMAACSNCHLVDDRQSHPPMDSVPSFDAIARNRSLTADRLRTWLYKPHWPMPDFGLSRQQVEDEVAYLLQRRQELPNRR